MGTGERAQRAVGNRGPAGLSHDGSTFARDLAAELRRLRAEAGLGLVQLAVRTNFSKSSLERYLNGKVLPPLKAVEAISRTCGGDTTRLVALRELAFRPPHTATSIIPLARPWPVPRQLPHDVSEFTGRSNELAALDDLIPSDGDPTVICAITGMGGIGKTALAVHFGHRVADRFRDGVLYVDLRAFGPEARSLPPTDALYRFLLALGLDPRHVPHGSDDRADLFRSLIAGRRMLLVLDNATTAAHIRPLLPGAPGCLVVVTSRNRLDGLIAREGARHIGLDVLTAEEADGLLTAIAGARRISAEPGAVAELARMCGHLPLALRIAAQRIATNSATTLIGLIGDLSREHDRLDVLTVADDDASTLRAAFSWSYRALPRDAARLFRLLGLHPGPDIATPAASALLGAGPARPFLDVLARAHLIEETARGRYRLHELLRIYAAERAEREESEQDRIRAVAWVLDWYLHTADTARYLLGPQRGRITTPPPPPGCAPLPLTTRAQALDWYSAEGANLTAVADQAVVIGRRDIAEKLRLRTRGTGGNRRR